MKLWLDLETKSRINLKTCGIAKYATDVTIIMAQWALGDGEVIVEDLTGGKRPSQALMRAMVEADEIWAQGAEFEQIVLATQAWYVRLKIDPRKWRCTMALARMHGLPGGLGKLSAIFKLGEDEAKDKRGHELIMIFCVPNKQGLFYDRNTHVNEWQEFLHYGGMDITSMRAVYRKCPKWNATKRMWRAWHLDQKMNMHGVAVDMLLAEGIVKAVGKAKYAFQERVTDMTLGVVQSATQVARLRAYMADYGVDLPDLRADTIERRLADENLPEHIKELLRIRQHASKSSATKCKRLLAQHVSGRLRNLLIFCGALRTGRFAGRTFQPQNLPRPKFEQWDIDEAIKRFRRGDIFDYAPDDVMPLAASCLRGLLVAESGRKLVWSDLANIEGRFMAWIAGEEWKLEAFRAFDRKEGPDLYKVSYSRPFRIDPNSIGDDDWRRQIGKVMELALQYYGGVGAFLAMADTYHLDLENMAKVAWPVIPQAIRVRAAANWQRAVKKRRTYGLAERTWLVCESLVLMWRDAHPAICKFWKDLEKAIKYAITHPGKRIPVGRCSVDRKGNWLRIRLPSGRYLSYPAPRAGEDDISFVGVNPYTRQWGRISTYSGKAAENIVQGGSADILLDWLIAADDAGYDPVLSVHDEIITEPLDKPGFNDKHLSQLALTCSPWAEGMPLAAKGHTSPRYRK